MKNASKTLVIILAITIAFSSSVFAQKKGKPFKGTVTYSLSYSGDGVEPAELAKYPKESSIKVYENRTLTDQGYASFITNGDSKMVYTVIDLSAMGAKKYLISQKAEEVEKDNKGTQYKYSEEGKEILGFKTKKVEITPPAKEDEDEEAGSMKITAYYTEDMGGEEVNFGNQMFHGVKGFVLEYELVTPKITVKAVAKTIEKGKVKETDFMIPSDCSEVTKEQFEEEIRALQGGGE
jgi:hypothetical protein